MSSNDITSYIITVCKDACKSENRPYTSIQFQYTIIKDKIFVFALKCKYDRVVRRILYRLHNNFEKKFGLVFNSIVSYKHEYRSGPIFANHQMIDYNYSFAEWDVFGEWNTLSYYDFDPDLNPHYCNNTIGDSDKENRYLYMKSKGAEFTKFSFCNHDDWMKFIEQYKNIYGHGMYELGETIKVDMGEDGK